MWKKWGKRYVFMDQANAEGGAGGGAADAEAQADAGAAAAAAANAPGSILATGAAPAGDNGTDYIPEKYRTNKEDGTFDLEGSSRKLAEAYTNAEKRIGTGDLPPKTAEEYAVTVPEAFKESFDAKTDPGMQKFIADAHAEGFTQKQIDLVMANYFDMAPKLVAGAAQLDADGATAELQKTWATDADFKRNVRNAYVGASALAGRANMDINALMGGPLGNNPDFLKLMAVIGPEFAEDTPPGGQTMTTQEDMNAVMSSDAYRDPKHPEHAKVSAKVKAYFERKHGTEAAA